MFRYQYYGDLLVIRGVGFNEHDGTILREGPVFPVHPVYRYLSAEEKSNPTVPELNAKWLCNYVHLYTEPNKMDILSLFGHATNPPWLHFEHNDGGVVRLTVSARLRDRIISTVTDKHSLNK